MKTEPCPAGLEQITQAHQLYQQLTGQKLTLRFERERLWYEWFRAGFELEDLRRVILYLQRQIRAQRRNIGALKLSNLLQPDRFEEDLAISQALLKPAPKPAAIPAPLRASPRPTPEEEQARQRALEILRQFKQTLR